MSLEPLDDVCLTCMHGLVVRRHPLKSRPYMLCRKFDYERKCLDYYCAAYRPRRTFTHYDLYLAYLASKGDDDAS